MLRNLWASFFHSNHLGLHILTERIKFISSDLFGLFNYIRGSVKSFETIGQGMGYVLLL